MFNIFVAFHFEVFFLHPPLFCIHLINAFDQFSSKLETCNLIFYSLHFADRASFS
jgi:hypothetical protein